MKTFKLIYEDRSGNELKTIVEIFNNKKEAQQFAKKLQAECMLNDLKKIIVKTF
jgi:hypothetical protein